MALFYECMLKCARKLLDTADIVREAMLRQHSEGSSGRRRGQTNASLRGLKSSRRVLHSGLSAPLSLEPFEDEKRIGPRMPTMKR